MRAYIIRRLLLIIPTLFLVTIIVFFSIRFIPGDVVDLLATEQTTVGTATAESIQENIRMALGLDTPVHIQYGRWLGGIFQGDFGTSLWSNRPITEMIFERLPVTLELSFLGILVALLISLPIGIYSAIRQDTAGDYTGRTIAILMISLPSFWIGTMVVVYPSIWWNWSPPIMYMPFLEHPWENIKQFILPAAIIGMVMSGATMRMTRTMMLEVLRQDYIRTAWAKGLSERAIILRHALKNALIPVITIVGLQVPILLGGEVIIEQIFGLPGMGRLLLTALQDRDYPVISAINVMIASAILVINLVVDLAYGYLDPRAVYR
ncbi:ABC transporter permease [Chloroflexota bacterium]